MKEMTNEEKISLSILCEIYNSREFKTLFGKSQLYVAPRTSDLVQLDEKLELKNLMQLVQESNVEIDMMQDKTTHKIPKESFPRPKKFSELLSYFLTDILQDDLQLMSRQFIEDMYTGVRTTDRGIHSVTVAIINGLVSKRVFEPNVPLTISMGLAHDIGHTPFGHEVEEAIDGLIEDVYKKHFPEELEYKKKAQEDMHSKKRNLFFSHERNGDFVFDEMMANTVESVFDSLRTVDKDGVKESVDDETMWQYDRMVKQIRSSIYSHTISRMSKEKLYMEQLVNGEIVEISRLSDKIAYTTSDLHDIFERGDATPEEIDADAKKIADGYIEKYCKEHNKEINPREYNLIFYEFASLDPMDKLMYMINSTSRGNTYAKMDPLIWATTKAYRKAAANVREKESFNKNTKAIFAVCYLNWQSTFLSKYRTETQTEEEFTEKKLLRIIKSTNETVCERTDKEAYDVAIKVLNGTKSEVKQAKNPEEQKQLEEEINNKKSEEALEDRYGR